MDGSSFNWTELQSPVARPKELMQSQFDSGARLVHSSPTTQFEIDVAA